MSQRVKTGIDKLDLMLEGGFPQNSAFVICGPPGTCKTIMALQYLKAGAELNEPGLYVSFEEDKKDIIEQAERFNWDFSSYEKEKLISIKSIKINEIKRDLFEEISLEAKNLGAKRMVIDSLSFLMLNKEFFENNNMGFSTGDKLVSANSVKQMTYYFINFIKELNMTVLFITGTKEDSIRTNDGISDYMCDGIIYLNMISMGSSITRTIEILKARKTNLEGGIHHLDINKNGLIIK